MMVQSRVVDVSKRGVRQSAAETRAMFSQFGEVLTVYPWRALDGQDHAFVEFKYKVSRNFRDRLQERTSFAIERVGDSDDLVRRFGSFKKAASSARLHGNPTLDASHAYGHAHWKVIRAQPMRHPSPAYRVKKHAPAPAALAMARRSSAALDYGSPPRVSSPDRDASRRIRSSPVRTDSVASSSAAPAPAPVAVVAAAAAVAVVAVADSVSTETTSNSRQSLSNARKDTHISPPSTQSLPPSITAVSQAPLSIARVHAETNAIQPGNPGAERAATPPTSSLAPPATPTGRQPILDIRNITPGTEYMLAPKETRFILPDLLAKNVTVNSYLKLAMHYRDKNMLKQAREVAHGALNELKRRGTLGQYDAMALNLFLSTVSTAYARACQPRESQKYMLEAARYISLAWATDTQPDPIPEPPAVPASSTAVQRPVPPSPEPKESTMAVVQVLQVVRNPRPAEDTTATALSPPLTVAHRVREERLPAPPRTASISSDAPSERTVVLEDADLHKMTLSEVLDMAGTLLKHAARLAALEGN